MSDRRLAGAEMNVSADSERKSPRGALLMGALALALVVIGALGAVIIVMLTGNGSPTPATTVSPTAAATTAPPPLAAVSSCVENYDGRMAAVVSITNTTDQVHGYVADVAFDSQDGTRQLDAGTASLRVVQPHEQSPIVVIGNIQVPRDPVLGSISVAEAYRCRLVSVSPTS